MNESIIQTKQYGIAISFIDLGVGLALATLMGWVVVIVYQYTHRGLSYERSFFTTLIMMAPILARKSAAKHAEGYQYRIPDPKEQPKEKLSLIDRIKQLFTGGLI